MTAQIAAAVKVAVSKLAIDPLNARKTFNAAKLAELAESIAHEGVLQNIVVRPAEKKGHYFITAGSRRFRAVNLLIEAGRLPKTFEFDCMVKQIDEAGAIALSIAENVMRDDMDPIEQYHAFAHLADAGLPIADIAARFSTTEIIVQRRLKLSKVHPDLHAEFSAGKMNFEQLSAFTITDDQEAQKHVWETLPYYNRSASQIKGALVTDGISATDKRLVFIGGLTAYEQAGGAVTRDLFAADGGYANDPALVESLVAQKFEETISALKAEGWAWIETLTEWSYPSVAEFDRHYAEAVALSEDEQAQHDALTSEHDELSAQIEEGVADDKAEERVAAIIERLDALEREAYDPEVIAKGGVFIALSYNGQLRIERGFVRREKKEAGSAQTDAAPEEKGAKLSAPLIEDLTAQKTAALRSELTKNHSVALVTVVHSMLLSAFYRHATDYSCLEISTKSFGLDGSLKEPQNSKALTELDVAFEDIKSRLPSNPDALWDWCMDLKPNALLELLAFAAAATVNVVEGKSTYRNAKHFNHSKQLAAALGTDMRNHFEPTVDNCFAHMNRATIQASVAEAMGEEFAKGIIDMKKSDAAAFAAKALKGTGWLPAPLVFDDGLSEKQGDAEVIEIEDEITETADIIQFPEAAA
ncbi:ParB/RepB/Spo0J family partition protein [Agrobacterium genomosp. 3]|uniref:ParB/RepB/Spo0J family partition protein n=1 Tax=Agrobacterium tomkonis TaxID=1183410 RepID=UPI001CD89ADD|nr:ParB/RepB/Spo0J family partition protein [Agrobacterium tomkonis]MCA1878893.1 ParB/RepB/Spo0J family partition protein [Agrobacterium tumefaciens]MCA1894114.1 ParB/RepB/Spo0J family partition protein [Agrobacterium tomkonis]